MRALRIRRPRAPGGTRRFTKAVRPAPRRRPVGPWPKKQAGYFDRVRRYARRVGHARVPYDYVEGSARIGLWVSRRRRDYREGNLTPEQVLSLEALPGWSWDPAADQFAARMELVRAFFHREGHARIPSDHREGGVALGHWAEHLRGLYRAGRLSKQRVRILERFPGWTWHPVTDLFGKGLAAVSSFARREGHTRVPHGHLEGHVRLDLWVANRRADHKKGKLSRDKVRALERIPGWTWSLRDLWFEEGFAHLLRHVEREGHARVPVDRMEGTFPLGAFVHKLRARRSRLGPARVRRLERLPGWVWHVHDARFARGVQVLAAFVSREGHARVPARHVEDGFPLGSCVGHWRQRRREMPSERRKVLEALPGWTWRVRPRRRRRRSNSRRTRQGRH